MAYWLLRLRLGFVLAAALSATACYTGPINMRPTVEIKRPTTRIHRGDKRIYTATKSDPDNNAVVLQWTTTPGDCPSNFKSPEAWPRSSDAWVTEDTLTREEAGTDSPFCVWVKAVDSHGAVAVDTYPEAPLNHVPDAHITVDLPRKEDLPGLPEDTFPLHTSIVLSSTDSTDADRGDPRNAIWMLNERPSPNVDLIDCPHVDSSEKKCLLADVAGAYVVELRFSDGMADDMEPVVVRKTLHVLPGNAPVAKLKILKPLGDGPYPLGTKFKITAEDSFDPDAGDTAKLRFIWMMDYSRAPTSSEDFGRCADQQLDSVWCFTGDGPGEYVVTLKVTDPADNTSPPVTLSLRVLDDQIPCIGATVPDADVNDLAASTQETKEFEIVNVLDDLDPFPNPMNLNDSARFDWFMSVNGAPFELASGDSTFPIFQLPSRVKALGNEVRVRLEVRDRNAARSRAAFQRCGDDDKCPSGPDCNQRLTWKVRFNR